MFAFFVPIATTLLMKSSNSVLLKRVLSLTAPHRMLFAIATFMAIILAPIGIIRPNLIQTIVDKYILLADRSGFHLMLIALVGVLILETLMQYAFTYITNYLGQSIIRDLRVRVFSHINSLNLAYFDRTPVGRNITRVISDIETLNSVFSQGVIAITADLLSIVVVLFSMFMLSWKLTLVCISMLPFLFIAAYYFKEGTKKSNEKSRTQVANMNTFLQERISGMRLVQIFTAEKEELDNFKRINKDYTKANIEGIFYYAIFFPIVEILIAASLGLMVWFGARGVLDNSVTLGALVAFPLYLNMLYRPVRVIADKFNTLQMGLIAADRVFEIIDHKEYINNTGTFAPAKIDGHVSFENVFFSYAPKTEENEWILKDVSFDLKAGETLAIVGSTGSGKTTIISLLNRFYDIQGGHIKIDGTDLREFELSALRQRIAVVLQDVFLFSGSVLENITLRDKAISRESVIEAAKMIGAHDFIEALPGGYDYEVMERGATLSMGQRQLISFVRALVFNPDILILDEATSSIDPQTEAVIQFAIEKLIERRTSIIIAHRLSTIRHAQNVLVLKKGEVLEYGSAQALLQQEDGAYRELYDMQFAQTVMQ